MSSSSIPTFALSFCALLLLCFINGSQQGCFSGNCSATGRIHACTSGIYTCQHSEFCQVTSIISNGAVTVNLDCRPNSSRPGKQCLVCGELQNQFPCNDMEIVIAEMTLCPDTRPYCMNDIIQTRDSVAQYKRCVDEATCDSLWYQATSDEPLCLHFDPSNGAESLTCHLCCYGDGCNVDTVPPVETLYRP